MRGGRAYFADIDDFGNFAVFDNFVNFNGFECGKGKLDEGQWGEDQ